MIFHVYKNEIMRDAWIRVTISCMKGHPTTAVVDDDPGAPHSRWGVCLDCVGVLDACMHYLTSPEGRVEGTATS